MLATGGSIANLNPASWAFEGKFDGCRLIVDHDNDGLRLLSRTGRNVTREYPQLASLGDILAEIPIVLDGEAVVLDSTGVPRFELIQNKAMATEVQFWAFDILSYEHRSVAARPYRARRQMLEMLTSIGITVPNLLNPMDPMREATERDWEGVVAKRWDGAYVNKRSRLWIKDKRWRDQEVVIGGWRMGEGRRAGTIGSLLMGRPKDGDLEFVGRVGTGFTDADLARLKDMFASLTTTESPFSSLPRSEMKNVTFVQPMLVGEVRYAEKTSLGILRQPSWRGLRRDKTVSDLN